MKRANNSWNKPANPWRPAPDTSPGKTASIGVPAPAISLWRSNPRADGEQSRSRARRTKPDFAGFVQSLVNGAYATAPTIHLVLDNLNAHFRGSFEQVIGVEVARQFLARIEFHSTPKPASWLNLAEIEIGILERQCLGRRIGSEHHLKAEVEAREQRRNAAGGLLQIDGQESWGNLWIYLSRRRR